MRILVEKMAHRRVRTMGRNTHQKSGKNRHDFWSIRRLGAFGRNVAADVF
jgi:hypothetical protein